MNENIPNEPQNIIVQAPPSRPKSNALLIAIIFILSIALTGFVAFYFGIQQKADDDVSSAPTPEVNQDSTPKPQSEEEVSSVNTATYQSPHLQNFSFSYDQDTWDEPVEVKVANNVFSPKITMRDKDGGTLTFGYMLAFGRGGGVITYGSGDIVTVSESKKLVRMAKVGPEFKSYYQYGTNSSLVDFQSMPDKKDEALKSCQEMTDGIEAMYFYTPQDCLDIKSGKIIGYAQDPAFNWSLRFAYLTKLVDINSQWNDQYVKDIDDGTVIVEVTYEGENPKEADEIVAQLEFI